MTFEGLVIFIAIVLALAATLTVVHWRHRRLLVRLQAERAGHRKQDFIDFFVGHGVRENVADDVYGLLQQWVPVPDFRVAIHDGLGAVYGMVVNDEIEDIIRDLGYPKLSKCEWNAYDRDEHSMITPRLKNDMSVAALVFFLDWVVAKGDERRVSKQPGGDLKSHLPLYSALGTQH